MEGDDRVAAGCIGQKVGGDCVGEGIEIAINPAEAVADFVEIGGCGSISDGEVEGDNGIATIDGSELLFGGVDGSGISNAVRPGVCIACRLDVEGVVRRMDEKL